MDPIPQPQPQPQPQTIIIERRERPSLLRRILGPLVFLVLGLLLFSAFFSGSAGLPTRLAERYVAGDITSAKVAVVEVTGTISGKETEHILKQIRQARDDDDCVAVILRVDSPGGAVSAADQIWREISLLKKPVVASLGGMAASGGYYVSAPCRLIIAEPTTLTGSIGVILELPQIGELMDKVGVKMETVTTGRWKDSGSPFHKELTDEERKHWGDLIGQAFDRFVRIVAQGRKLPAAAVRKVADGRVLTAHEALEAGLIDRIGYLDDAIREAWSLAKIESSRVIRYARPVDWTDALGVLATPARPLELSPNGLLPASGPQMLYLAR